MVFNKAFAILRAHKAHCMVRYRSDKGCSTTSYISSKKVSPPQAQYCPMLPEPLVSPDTVQAITKGGTSVQEVTNKTPFASPPAPCSSKTIPAHQCGGRTTVQVDAPPETRVQRPSEFAEMRHHLTQAEQRCTVRHPRCICVALLPLKCALQIIWRASCSRFHVLYWQKQV